MRAFASLWTSAKVSIAGAIFVAPALLAQAHAQTLDLSHYTKTFEDDFTKLDISAWGPGTRWIAHTPWHGDFGDAVFDNPGPNGPFSIGPSGLNITARKDELGHWRSGLICSMDKDGPGQQGFAQQYGYFEMRAKLPDGPGVWPAFWLIGVNKATSASEIDVLEYYGAFPGYFNSWLHLFQGGKDVLQGHKITAVPPGSLTSRFNDYGVLIGPDETRFYLNRQEFWAAPTPPEYRQPMYILANLALGSGWPIDKLKSPAIMEISHIVVYQADSRLSPTTPSSPKK
jgi:beta-glucanase (GH16 family)